MAMTSVTVSRNMPATTETGEHTLLTLATITHENGVQQTVAIREDEIRMMGSPDDDGKAYIMTQIEKAAANPQKPQLDYAKAKQ